uniref:FAM21/CAPZIP domain-containing protein n=1 Tax=Culex tarsalis TaxID=7177 RepID=A0A1Q3F1I3_CULTA
MALPPDELRKRIPQWSLESDGQLLQYMVQISKNLEQKCKQTQNNLNTLLLQLDETHIRFANASNGFNGVQQVKFVENRVKDDDESFYSVREEIEEPGERLPHAEIFQMAVEKSIANMYKCFEKVTVELGSDSDSEDDDEEVAARNTVLRAVQKYPYIGRPLPYIIGSREWREKWHAGLIDSEEESEADTKEQYSESSEDTDDGMFASQATSNHTPSESEGSVWGVHADPRRKRAPSVEPSVSGDDTLSVHSATSSVRRPLMAQHKVPVLPTTPAFRPPSLFPDQPPADDTCSVSSRTKVANLFEESDEEESTPTHQPVVQPAPSFFKGNAQQQQARKTINLFEDEPPPADPDVTPSTSNGSDSTKKQLNLFIESDDDGDDSINNNVNRSEPKKAVANLFGGNDDALNNNDDDDLFVPVKQSVNGATRRIANLFDDEPPVDDFDEIFKPKATAERKAVTGGKLVLPPIEVKKEAPATVKTVEVTSPKKGVNLFDEENDDEFFKPGVAEKKNQQAVPTTVSKPKVNLFDDDESGDEVPPVVVAGSTKPVVNQTPSIRAEILKKKSIFDSDSDEEDDEDALFGGVSNTNLGEKTKVQVESVPSKVELPVLEVTPSKVDPAVVEVSPAREKPAIPDKPPEEEDTWDVPPDDEYPHVANDIDYFLTTNTISVGMDGGSDENKLKEPLKVEEPPTDVSAEPIKQEPPAKLTVPEPPKSALNFTSIGLFDDVPPPDDEFDEPSLQPATAGDHGEDIFGSRPNSGKATAGQANHRYLFLDDDGPPPDDRDEVDDRKEPVSTKISAIIDEMRQKSESEEQREKPKINRLNAKVNINVSALLPGARRPAAASAPAPEEPEVPSRVDSAAEIKHPQPEQELGTGKLTQLNKGRAKIQTKRKPPTRQLRRATYESSLEQDSPIEESTKETRVVVGSEVKPQHVEVTAAHLHIPNQLLSGELSQKLEQPKRFENVEDRRPESKPASAVIVAAPEPKKPAVANATPKSSSKLFSDDESDDDDLFGKLAKTAPTKAPPAKQVTHVPAPMQPPKTTPSTATKQSIFDDSDDDDLFSKRKPAPKAVPAAAATSTMTSPDSSKPKPPSGKVKSIFSSDEDSDDIFASSKSKQAPPKALEKKTTTKSLFGTSDGEDDEDDLFGAKSKTTPKPAASQPNPAAQRKPDKSAFVAGTPTSDDPLADLLRS